MLFDVRNAVVGAPEKLILGGPIEVYLCSEHFGWYFKALHCFRGTFFENFNLENLPYCSKELNLTYGILSELLPLIVDNKPRN